MPIAVIAKPTNTRIVARIILLARVLVGLAVGLLNRNLWHNGRIERV
jgi:hypothetical protein